MEASTVGGLPVINPDLLTNVVRSALSQKSAEVKTWHLAQIGGGLGNPVSVGLYRVQGAAYVNGLEQSWSVILKVLQSPQNLGLKDMGEGEDPTHWNYWKREPLVYQSGFLDHLPDGLAAPQCYAVEELPGNITRLWLEEIHDMYQSVWNVERYSLTARHLGRLSGRYINWNDFPEFPWLGRDLNRQWLRAFAWQDLPWAHPFALDRYPEPDNNFFKQLLFQHERFLGKLEMLPESISHGDTYPTNFMSRIGADGAEQTVALDWALMGLQPLGYDLGQFVFGAINQLKDVPQKEIIDTLFESYYQGLRDEGCQLDKELVRLGFAVSAALRVGLFQVLMLSMAIQQSAADVKIQESNNTSEAFEVVMAREVFRLIG